MNEQPTDQSQQTAAQPEQVAMTGVRKRQQIQNTNKRIFLWLAGAAVIVSICLVALQFLVREFMFNQTVISKKADTNKTLVQNIEQANELQKNINALLANENLNALKYEAETTETTALNVILDALPTDGDATAFANSLQAVVLPRSGVSLRELDTTSLEDPLALQSETAIGVAPAADTATTLTLPFSAGFSGKYENVQQALIDMARVIRPINLTELAIRADDNNLLQVDIAGVTYYLPAKTVEVRMEPITAEKKS